MDYRPFADTEVSSICLGTMTWGEQNTREEAFEQMDYALDQGINFFDVAEMYPVHRLEVTRDSRRCIMHFSSHGVVLTQRRSLDALDSRRQ